MRPIRISSLAGNTLWGASQIPAWVRFNLALRDPVDAQRQVLRAILRDAQATQFARHYGLEQDDDPQRFAAKVPVHEYTDMIPWINRIRVGQQCVLSNQPVIRLAITSGTGAARKLIPYTHGLQRQMNNAIGPWMIDLFSQFPNLMPGSAYWSISPVVDFNGEDSIVPIGFENDSDYLGVIGKKLVETVMAVPQTLSRCTTVETWKTHTVEALRQRRDLRLISIWHPSFFELLLDAIGDLPKSLWPALQLVSCWGDGHARSAMIELQRRFPGTRFQPKGLLATEGVVTIPFQNHYPLAICSHFFEFLRPDKTIVTADQLETGETVEPVLTTAGGLFRYRLHDSVRVEGRLLQTPELRFLGKSDCVSDRFGEKLAEPFVAQILADIRSEVSLDWTFALLAPELNRYVLYVRGPTPPQLSATLDRRLRANPHYHYCRQLGQLAAPKVVALAVDPWPIYSARLMKQGKRLGEIKPTALSALDGWEVYFSPTGK